LNEVICADDFGEAHFGRLAKVLSGASETLKKLWYVKGALRSLAQLDTLSENELPVLASGAVLVNIPRGNAYLLDDLEKLAADADDGVLPYTAVGPIPEVPSDEPGDGAEAQGGSDGSGTDLLFPLESNIKQREVARLSAVSRVLVVHGPPGTGKSQTICNLICRLVASGKTVLVTSQKDKALQVVRDKLPNVDYLAMAMLRSDKDSQRTPLQALDYYQAAIGGGTEVIDRRYREGRGANPAADHITTMTELLRKSGVNFPGGKKLLLENLRPLGVGWLHAESEAARGNGCVAAGSARYCDVKSPLRVPVSFGPRHGPVTAIQTHKAAQTASVNGYEVLVLASFSVDPETKAFIPKTPIKNLTIQFANVNPDVLV
jgi:hypothetical protein